MYTRSNEEKGEKGKSNESGSTNIGEDKTSRHVFDLNFCAIHE